MTFKIDIPYILYFKEIQIIVNERNLQTSKKFATINLAE